MKSIHEMSEQEYIDMARDLDDYITNGVPLQSEMQQTIFQAISGKTMEEDLEQINHSTVFQQWKDEGRK